MKTCPICKEVNGDNNIKCFKCGAILPKPIFKETLNNTAPVQKMNTDIQKMNSEKISTMATVICIVGLIFAIILGFVFQVETVTSGLYSTHTEYSFNWVLCISTAIGTVCFAIILKAMSYITKAIEEK